MAVLMRANEQVDFGYVVVAERDDGDEDDDDGYQWKMSFHQ